MKKGIILGDHFLEKVIEVDRAKVEVIERLPPPISAEGVKSFLGMRVSAEFSSRIL